VLGGNGFVGSHVCKEALAQGYQVMSVSRRGGPKSGDADEKWAKEVHWVKGDIFDSKGEWANGLSSCRGVISCVGGFGSVAAMEKINGDANIAAIKAAHEQKVPRFVFVSAHDYRLPQFMYKGYFHGKRRAELELEKTYGSNGVSLRPGFIYGSRKVGSFSLPLWMIGSPLAAVTNLSFVQKLQHVSLIGPLVAPFIVPPVDVRSVAKAAVDAAVNPGVSGSLDVFRISSFKPSPGS